VTSREHVQRWISGYESAWRTPGTEYLAALFADGASYLQSPYAKPIVGHSAIADMWETERDGPGEVFTIETEIVAVDGDTAVVHAQVRYGDPVRQEYRDLWVLRFDDAGLCAWFEEWAYWPGLGWTAHD
jgi:ketosteroid isomerase-like protein